MKKELSFLYCIHCLNLSQVICHFFKKTNEQILKKEGKKKKKAREKEKKKCEVIDPGNHVEHAWIAGQWEE